MTLQKRVSMIKITDVGARVELSCGNIGLISYCQPSLYPLFLVGKDWFFSNGNQLNGNRRIIKLRGINDRNHRVD